MGGAWPTPIRTGNDSSHPFGEGFSVFHSHLFLACWRRSGTRAIPEIHLRNISRIPSSTNRTSSANCERYKKKNDQHRFRSCRLLFRLSSPAHLRLTWGPWCRPDPGKSLQARTKAPCADARMPWAREQPAKALGPELCTSGAYWNEWTRNEQEAREKITAGRDKNGSTSMYQGLKNSTLNDERLKERWRWKPRLKVKMARRNRDATMNDVCMLKNGRIAIRRLNGDPQARETNPHFLAHTTPSCHAIMTQLLADGGIESLFDVNEIKLCSSKLRSFQGFVSWPTRNETMTDENVYLPEYEKLLHRMPGMSNQGKPNAHQTRGREYLSSISCVSANSKSGCLQTS